MTVKPKLQDTLSYPPRGMNADYAAAYVGFSKTKFLELVESGHMPQPRNIGGVHRWDRLDLDAAYSAASPPKKPRKDEPASFDEMTFDAKAS